MKLSTAVVLLLLAALALPAAGQLKIPSTSQLSTLTQSIGVTDVTIRYSRPGVKGREIWGKLVPFDAVWRTGANAATMISFSDTVKVEGHTVPPGSYGLATIPSSGSWTVILHNKPDMEGAFDLKKEDEVARFTVMPQTGEFQEWMRFTFEDLKENAGTVVLAWEKLRIPFTIETPTFDLVMRSAWSTISYEPPMQAANYLLGKKTDLAQAMIWIDQSLSIKENYWNLRVKAQILAASGKKSEGIAVMERAIAIGEKMKSPPFDFAQMKEKLSGWKK